MLSSAGTAVCVAIAMLSQPAAEGPGRTPLVVSSDFEGGSATVLAINQDERRISFTPGGDPGRGWPCWWYFRIDGLQAGETAALELRGSPLPARNNGQDTGKPLAASWAMPERATFSTDRATWRHTAPGELANSRMRYEVTGEGGPVWVAWGPPFTPEDTDRLIAATLERRPEAVEFELARSRDGRPVRGIKFAPAGVAGAPCLWIQARQHAWESGASWVGRGLVEWLAGDSAEAKSLRERVEVRIIPIMDVDNVATGNGGKEADPRDHNRDWDARPVYPEVAAAQKELRQLASERRLRLFIDLHNPAPKDVRPFFFMGPPEFLAPVDRDRREKLVEIAARKIADPLPLLARPRLTGPSYHPLWRQISGQWVDEIANPGGFAVCLETSWNTPHSTTAGYLTVGRQLGEAIAELMEGESAAIRD